MPLPFLFGWVARVALLLAVVVTAMRAKQDTKASAPEPSSHQEVALDVQYITMNEATCQKLGLCCTASTDSECKTCCDSKNECGKGCAVRTGVKFLTKREADKLLETLLTDSTASVGIIPHLLPVGNGKNAYVEPGGKKEFVTGVTIRTKEGETTFTPEVESHWLGWKFDLHPVVSADGRYVKLSVNATMSALESEEIPFLPISVPVTLKQETNGEPRTEIFTQIIQQPKFRTVKIEKELVLPDGGTAVFQAGKWTQEVKHVTPILSDIPYLNRLFTNVGMETKCVVMIVKAGIVMEEKTESTLRK